MKQAAVRKDVIPQLTGPISSPDTLDLGISASVQDAQVQVAAGIVEGPIKVIGIKDAVDDEICEGKEHG